VENGGTISHQHGVGTDHAPYLAAEKGELGLSSMQALFSTSIRSDHESREAAAMERGGRFCLGRAVGLVVIGGGITGAGILLEAARRGSKALLVEQRDFAWGTSSRSSKLVHGGLRYLKEGQLGLTRESVHEREHLLQQAAGLVEPQSLPSAIMRAQAGQADVPARAGHL
jgi:hypothetical protein